MRSTKRKGGKNSLTVRRLPVTFTSDIRRVITRFFDPGGEARIRSVVERVNGLSDDQVDRLLNGVLRKFAPGERKNGDLPVMCSPRGVLVEARRDIAGPSKVGKSFYRKDCRCAAGAACAHHAETNAGMASSQGSHVAAAAYSAEAHQAAKGSNPQQLMRSLTHINGNGIAWHP